MVLFLGAVLEYVIPSLSFVGKESEKIWFLKSLPVSGKEIIMAKSYSQLLLMPVFVIMVALPLPLIIGLEMAYLLMFTLMGLAMSFFFLAIGVWAGARYPNMDPSVKGAPDIMTMYVMVMLCLLSSLVLFGVPAYIFMTDRFIALLDMVLVVAFSVLMLFASIGNAGKKVDLLER